MMTVDTKSEAVLDLISKTLSSSERILIGVAGPPGSGKSTLAEVLVSQLNARARTAFQAALLPMDGFHLDNELLRQRGLLARKGAPETFDVAGLVELLLNVKTGSGDVHYPLFDRALDHSLKDAGLLKAETSIVVVEGNYLLLDAPDWKEISKLFDATVFLQPPLSTLENRLMKRWLSFGFSAEEATEKAHGNDLKNALLVLEYSLQADLTLSEDAMSP